MTSSSPGLDRAINPRPQFSVRELLVATLVVAIGLMLYRLHDVWPSALQCALAVMSAGIIVSLIVQIRNFRRELRRAGLSRETRWGLRFAITSRITAIILLAIYHVSDDVLRTIDPHVFTKLGMSDWNAWIHYYLALVIVLAGTRQLAARRREKKHAVLRYVRGFVLAAIAVAALSYLLREWLLVHYYTHKGLVGIENQILTSKGVDTPAAERAEPAFWLGLVTPILVPLTYLLIYVSTRDESWPRGSKLARGALAIVFPAYIGMFVWNYFVALPRASPFLIWQAPQSSLWEMLLVGLPCFLLLTTAIAYRWSARTTAPRRATDDEPASRGPYLHEDRWFIALFAMTLTMQLAFGYMPLFDESRGGFRSVGEGVAAMFAFPAVATPALLAVLILAVSAIFARWSSRQHLPPTTPMELPPGRFLFIWLGVAVTTLVALPVLASYGFALWLAPSSF